MRRPPPKKPASQAQVKHSTTIRKGSRGPVVHHEDATEPLEVQIPPGPHSVSAGYDIKYWASDQNHGMTIGASAHVKISCYPGGEDEANNVASELAWDYMNMNACRAKKKLMAFVDGKEDA